MMSSCISCELVAMALVLAILMWISPTSRFYMKMIVFLVTSMLSATILPLPLFIMRPRDYRNAYMPAWSCRVVGRLLGANFEVRGHENINKSKGGVVLINHQSGIDLMVLAYLWPVIGRATVVAKKELLYLFPFGTASYLWGTIFINRSSQKDSLTKLNKESNAIINKAAKLLFFPEGTRHQGYKLLPFKKGPFHIAVQSQSLIQPVVVSKYTFLDSDNKFFGRGQSVISVLPEIDCKGMSKEDIPRLIEKTQKLMQDHFDELNANSQQKPKTQ